MSGRCPRCGTTYTEAERFCTRDGARLAPADAPLEEPAPLIGSFVDGRYYVERKIGEGGMALVYLARDELSGTPVALKVLAPQLSRDLRSMARLRREAAIGAHVSHPNICAILHVGETPEGAAFVAMPYLQGELLCDRVNKLGHIRLDEATWIVRDIAHGLHAAHEAEVIHRDLKPENVMLVQGTEREMAVVMDFGLAKPNVLDGPLEKLTATGIVLGTPEFMSPEQLRGKELDGRSDLYALGVLVSEMLTGKLPFEGRTPQELMLARLRTGPVPIRKLRPELEFPGVVEEVLLRAMARRPTSRYPTTRAFAAAFDAAVAAGEVERARGSGV